MTQHNGAGDDMNSEIQNNTFQFRLPEEAELDPLQRRLSPCYPDPWDSSPKSACTCTSAISPVPPLRQAPEGGPSIGESWLFTFA